MERVIHFECNLIYYIILKIQQTVPINQQSSRFLRLVSKMIWIYPFSINSIYNHKVETRNQRKSWWVEDDPSKYFAPSVYLSALLHNFNHKFWIDIVCNYKSGSKFCPFLLSLDLHHYNMYILNDFFYYTWSILLIFIFLMNMKGLVKTSSQEVSFDKNTLDWCF